MKLEIFVVYFKDRNGEVKFVKTNGEVVKFSPRIAFDTLKKAEKSVKKLNSFVAIRGTNCSKYKDATEGLNLQWRQVFEDCEEMVSK